MKILVLGDAMKDVYYHGHVNRLNPEKHSAPLLHVSHTLEFPGGAANVAKNLTTWGVQVTMISGAGEIVKNRIVDNDGVICRFDIGDELVIAQSLPDEKFDCVVVSDYNKGTVAPFHAKQVAEYKCPIFVDTKSNPALWLDVATCMFPNMLEYSKHPKEYREAKLALVKMGNLGAQFFRRGVRSETFRSYADKVVNVSGAGDTVLAAYAMMWCYCLQSNSAQKQFELDAALFAMQMAAVSVSTPFTHAPTGVELVDRFPNLERQVRFMLEEIQGENAS